MSPESIAFGLGILIGVFGVLGILFLLYALGMYWELRE